MDSMIKRKSRYILVESAAPLDADGSRAAESLQEGLLRIMGEARYTEAHPSVVQIVDDNRFILRVNRGLEDSATLALAFITELNGRRTGLYTTKTSGTIRALLKTATLKLH